MTRTVDVREACKETSMKRTLLWVALTSLVTGPVLYASADPQTSTTKSTQTTNQQSTTGQSSGTHSGHKASGHKMKGEVVSYDANTKMLTLKDAKGVQSTTPVEGQALTDVTHFKAGDKVTATMNNDSKAITGIRTASASKSKSKTKAS
jgi:Ni/Co efflux regulator RcnB